MEGIGIFDQKPKGYIPYDNEGKPLTKERRQAMERRRGVCLQCNVPLVEKRGILQSKKPITNDKAYKGICIACNPAKVPLPVLAQWEVRQKRNVLDDWNGRGITTSFPPQHKTNLKSNCGPEENRSETIVSNS